MSRISNDLQKNNRDKTFPCLFDIVADKYPDKIAIESQERSYCYSDIKREVTHFAEYIFKLAFLNVSSPNKFVALCFDRSYELILSLLAVNRSGGAYINLDPDYPENRIHVMLNDAKPVLVITCKKYQNKFKNLPNIKLLLIEDYFFSKSKKNRIVDFQYVARNDDLAYVMYTSGTTGVPKGVMIEHRNLYHVLCEQDNHFLIDPTSRFLQFTSPSFDPFVLEVGLTLLSGATLVVAEREAILAGETLHKTLQRLKITHVILSPSILLQTPSHDLPELVLLMTAGEKCSIEVIKKWASEDRVILNGYGPTETTLYATYSLCYDNNVLPTLGKPLKGVDIYICDFSGKEVSNFEVGELYIGGKGVGRGYLDRNEMNAQHFVVMPFSPTCLYRTGDLVKKNLSGELEYLGRIDDQVKIDGHRIELNEIELCLSRFEKIKHAIVSSEHIENKDRLVAYLFSKNDEILNATELRVYLSKRLPRYMVPSIFMIISTVPVNTNGKVDRKKLAMLNKSAFMLRKNYVPPTTKTQLLLSKIWSEFLVEKEIGLDDDFFALGGSSLLIGQLVVKIEYVFGVKIPLADMFACTTLKALSAKIDSLSLSHHDSRANEFHMVHDEDSRFLTFPLTDTQQAYYVGSMSRYFELSSVESHIYMEYDISGFDLKKLEMAWNELINRHDMLRAIILHDGQQVVDKKVPYYSFITHDLRRDGMQINSPQFQKIREQLSHHRYPHGEWPLFDIHLTLLKEAKQILHLSFNFITIDGFSLHILFREWVKLYYDKHKELPELSITFRDYIDALKNKKKSQQYLLDEKYWKNQLLDLFVPPGLPVYREKSFSETIKFNRVSRSIKKMIWAGLKEKLIDFKITPTVFLLFVYSEIIGFWSKNKNFSINLTLFERLPMHHNINDIVGDFTTLLYFSLKDIFSKKISIKAKLRLIQERLFLDLDHRLYGGIEALRQYAKTYKDLNGMIMPVVFTSILGYDFDSFGEESDHNLFFKPIFGISQTPQVFLDCKVYERSGSLIIEWDYVEGLFPEGLIELMHSSYCEAVERLGREEIAWEGEELVCLPSDQAEEREDYNKTDWAVGLGLLPSL
ncbi:MAG: amino acid adenylation domain-containing protein, partial [Gammaproteobacteria bacterium]|nr:amino acid adenylation domain-containing protein [Gammaproteobacteria bacterium]